MRKVVPSLRRHRYRRLLVLCAGSAAVHLAVLHWIAGRPTAPAAVLAPPPELTVRLLRPGAPAVPPVATGRAPPPDAAAAPAMPAFAGRSGPRVAARQAATPGKGKAPDAAPNAAPDHDAAPALATPGTPLLPMPGRYRVRLPPPARLAYTLVRATPGSAPVAIGSARLDWRTGDGRYLLELDGVAGRLRSEGVSGDTGVVPHLAQESRDGASLVTEFDAGRRRVLFHADGDASDGDEDAPPHQLGMQDRASVLIQLAAIGLADPGQFDSGIRIVVADAHAARIVAFEVLGREQIATGAGRLWTWHLAQGTARGAARLEVWLAPERDWLPVQLRVVEANGAGVTQTLDAVLPAAAIDDVTEATGDGSAATPR